MTTPQITTPGAPPDPLAPQPTFRATFYAYLQQLVTAFGQANTLATWMATTSDTVATNANTASTQAGIATTKAGEASGSAEAAAASEDAVEAVAIGSYADDAAADASGKTIVDGVFYYKTSAPTGLRLRKGGAWVNAVIDAAGALVAANSLSDVVAPATARINLGTAERAWSTKTTAYTSIAGDRILADTSGGVFTVTLPASPTAGDEVWFADPGSNWATNNLTVSGNGNNIDGASTFAANVNEGHFIATYNGSAWVVRFTGGAA